jgi:hypothetical protein
MEVQLSTELMKRSIGNNNWVVTCHLTTNTFQGNCQNLHRYLAVQIFYTTVAIKMMSERLLRDKNGARGMTKWN